MTEEISQEISYEQALEYAREVSRLYRMEKDKSKQLEDANIELEKLRQQLELENNYLREEVDTGKIFDRIIGNSAALNLVLKDIETVAKSDATILVLGETGTGKELIARAIHERSGRSKRPMIKVNCGAISSELFESEFFGHTKGAFTGAVNERIGRFQLADKGTLFLDEVGEIPLNLQSKILRVLQDGEFEQVGGDETKHVDVRIIAATNRDLEADVKNGDFREDLFYRLNVFPIKSPPLRDRKEDINSLATHFRDVAIRKFKKPNIEFTKENILQLEFYDWPGNIREMQNVIEHAVLKSENNHINLEYFAKRPLKEVCKKTGPTNSIEFSGDVLKDKEKEVVLAALEITNWKIYGKRGAGELLGIQPATLAYRIKKMGLRRP